jgi:hypothetical protein
MSNTRDLSDQAAIVGKKRFLAIDRSDPTIETWTKCRCFRQRGVHPGALSLRCCLLSCAQAQDARARRPRPGRSQGRVSLPSCRIPMSIHHHALAWCRCTPGSARTLAWLRARRKARSRRSPSKCRGWISQTPDYLLNADTAFFELYVLGRSRSDVLLVVRKPDGSVACNDNRQGTKDPMIRSHFPIGTSQVWVGVKQEGGTAAYRLGFSEVKWKSSSIPLPDAD